VFALSHPCFDIDDRSMWVIERHFYETEVFRKITGYRQEKEFRVPWKISKAETGYTLSYHRPLSTYLRYLRAAGLAVVRMEEPMPMPEALRKSPQAPFMVDIPLHLVVEAVPLRAGRAGGRRRGRLTRPASQSSGRTPATGSRRSGSRGRTRGTGSGRRGSKPGS
jgi:hypothetical protein